MEEKRALEQFRLLQFAESHGSMHLSGYVPADAQPSSHPLPVPDSSRVILHFDVDAFYAQVEEVRDPRLRDVPLGVTQKYLIVTCNYPARAAGITKLMNTQDAKQKCPGLQLISGEDLTPYRQASKRILAVLQRYGPAERLGMDEVWVDVTKEVHARIAAGAYERRFHGHVHNSSQALLSESRHRPQDLRVTHKPQGSSRLVPQSDAAGCSTSVTELGKAQQQTAVPRPVDRSSSSGSGGSRGSCIGALVPPQGGEAAPWELLLQVGSSIALEARRAVRQEAGFRSSAGVACNKTLAKLVSGLHKPDDQTVLLPCQAADFVGPLPIRALPGVGFKTEAAVRRLGVATAADARRLTSAQLVAELGERVGLQLYDTCRGRDSTPVKPYSAPKSITVEDSFKSCASGAAARAVLCVLVPDLLARLHEEWQESRRRPQTLTLKWRHRNTGWHRSSASCPMPIPPLQQPPTQPQADRVVVSAMALLAQHVPEPFNLSLLNVGATNFKPGGGGGGSSGRLPAALQQLLSGQGKTTAATGDALPSLSSPAVASWPHPVGCSNVEHSNCTAPPAAAALDSGRAACNAADASAVSRRDYGSVPQAALMTKSRERQLRELGATQAAQAKRQKLCEADVSRGSNRGLDPDQMVIDDDMACHDVRNGRAAGACAQPAGSDMRHCMPLVLPSAACPHPQPQLQGGVPRVANARPFACHDSVTAAVAGAAATPQDDSGHGGAYATSSAADHVQAANDAQLGWQRWQQLGVLDYDVLEGYEGSGEDDCLDTGDESSWGDDGVEQDIDCYMSDNVAIASKSKQHTSEQAATALEAADAAQTLSGSTSFVNGQGHSTDLFSLHIQAAPASIGMPTTGQGAGCSTYGLRGSSGHMQGVAAKQLPPLHPNSTTDVAQRQQQRKRDEVLPFWHPHARPASATSQQQQQQPSCTFNNSDNPALAAVAKSSATAGHGRLHAAAAPGIDGGGAVAPPLAPSATNAQLCSGGVFDIDTARGGENSVARDGGGSAPSSYSERSDLQRVILHVDVDCFYCSVERIDDPSLRGVPLAVRQFNSGGFVAVSYEARAAGVRCGDGVGAGGRANIARLRDSGAVSEAEAIKMCPGLQIRPMRTDRYREVAAAVHQLLRRFAPDGQVEKTSYDDFYLDITAACTAAGTPPATCPATAGADGAPADPPPHVHVAGGGGSSWTDVEPRLRGGVAVAETLRAALLQEIGLTASCGVAGTKLLARLVGPLNKPDAVTVLPYGCSVAFIGGVLITRVPGLQQKVGHQVVSELGVTQVSQLAGFSRNELERRFGKSIGGLLAELPHARDVAPVRERGPQKSLLCERSFPPLTRFAAVKEALESLVDGLWPRLLQDCRDNVRVPAKLVLTWRQGYSPPRSKSADMPPQVLAAQRLLLPAAQRGAQASIADMAVASSGPATSALELARDAATAVDTQRSQPLGCQVSSRCADICQEAVVTAHDAATCRQLLEAAAALFKSAMGGNRGPLQITRLAVAACYDAGGSSGSAAGCAVGQQQIRGFLAAVEGRQPQASNSMTPTHPAFSSQQHLLVSVSHTNHKSQPQSAASAMAAVAAHAVPAAAANATASGAPPSRGGDQASAGPAIVPVSLQLAGIGSAATRQTGTGNSSEQPGVKSSSKLPQPADDDATYGQPLSAAAVAPWGGGPPTGLADAAAAAAPGCTIHTAENAASVGSAAAHGDAGCIDGSVKSENQSQRVRVVFDAAAARLQLRQALAMSKVPVQEGAPSAMPLQALSTPGQDTPSTLASTAAQHEQSDYELALRLQQKELQPVVAGGISSVAVASTVDAPSRKQNAGNKGSRSRRTASKQRTGPQQGLLDSFLVLKQR